ncbi:MAG: heparinase II/III family protein [Alphaproteobacteria bacterium]|nr:heparinase II/III family protein [Alphaproteobacteria bacterium]
MLVKPSPLWAGDAAAGEALMRGAFTHYGQTYAFPDPFQHNIWMPPGMSAEWLTHLHSFAWLADLRAVAGEDSVRAGFTLIDNWCRVMKSSARMPDYFTPFAPGVMGTRLANWIAHADIFLPESGDEAFRDLFFSQLEHQALTLHKTLCGARAARISGACGFQAIKGLLYSGLALEGRENWIEEGLTLLGHTMQAEILKDGGHISRSPGLLFEVFRLLLDIRTALSSGGYPAPETLEDAIERAGTALKFFRTGRGMLPRFHQTERTEPALIDQALGQAVLPSKPYASLPHTGYERLSLGRSCVIFDTGIAPPPGHDALTHAAPLAFEFFYGREAVFVNCGTHPTSHDWQAVLRSTPAHNTLTMDGRNAFEIKPHGGLGRKSRRAGTRRMDGKDYQLAESSHDGYEGLNGFIHSRRLYLGNKGHDLRGEETLESSIGKPMKSADFALRFHLHPRCSASLIQNGQEVLVRMPGGIGWRFFQEGGYLSLEDSIAMGPDNQPRKTLQIVLSGQASQALTQIKWALQREGI